MSNKTDTCCVCQKSHWQGSDCSHVLVGNGLKRRKKPDLQNNALEAVQQSASLILQEHRTGDCLESFLVAFIKTNVQRSWSKLCSIEQPDLLSLIYFLSGMKKAESRETLFNEITNAKCYYKEIKIIILAY